MPLKTQWVQSHYQDQVVFKVHIYDQSLYKVSFGSIVCQ